MYHVNYFLPQRLAICVVVYIRRIRRVLAYANWLHPCVTVGPVLSKDYWITCARDLADGYRVFEYYDHVFPGASLVYYVPTHWYLVKAGDDGIVGIREYWQRGFPA